MFYIHTYTQRLGLREVLLDLSRLELLFWNREHFPLKICKFLTKRSGHSSEQLRSHITLYTVSSGCENVLYSTTFSKVLINSSVSVGVLLWQIHGPSFNPTYNYSTTPLVWILLVSEVLLRGSHIAAPPLLWLLIVGRSQTGYMPAYTHMNG